MHQCAGKLPSEKDDPLVLAVASGVLMLASSVGHRLDGLACPLSAGSQNIALATTSGEMPEMASVREEPSVADLMAFNGILPEVHPLLCGRVVLRRLLAT